MLTRPMRAVASSGPLAIALALVAAGAAPAATIATSPCVPVIDYSTKNMAITGAGFTPGAYVTVRYASALAPDPTYLTAGTADAAGNFGALVSPPLFNKLDTQQQTFALGASEDANPANTASTTYEQVRVGYTREPPTGTPKRIVKHTVRGFPTGKNTYLHFRFLGQTRKNVKLGMTAGPCGIVSRRLPLLPAKARTGTWTVYVDQAKVYSKRTQPQLKYSFPIRITFRP